MTPARPRTRRRPTATTTIAPGPAALAPAAEGPALVVETPPEFDDRAVAPEVVTQQRSGARISITHETVVTGAPAEALYEAYLESILPLTALAVLKHLDTKAEVLANLANPRIEKIVGWQGDVPVGLAMVTNSLEDVSEISPDFLRSKYPEHAAKNRIYVGMLMLVSPRVRGLTLFGRLYTELWQVPALAGGILVFDVCEFNRTMFDTDLLAKRIADNFPRSAVEVLDRQTWYVAELPEPIPDHRPL